MPFVQEDIYTAQSIWALKTTREIEWKQQSGLAITKVCTVIEHYFVDISFTFFKYSKMYGMLRLDLLRGQ